jgi:hypothetical protein
MKIDELSINKEDIMAYFYLARDFCFQKNVLPGTTTYGFYHDQLDSWMSFRIHTNDPLDKVVDMNMEFADLVISNNVNSSILDVASISFY